MEIKIIFNNEVTDPKLSGGWGFSCLIGDSFLFDTGEAGNLLSNNLNYLNVDISKIRSIFISHEHWDHIGGLWFLLNEIKNLNVYICPGFSDEFKNKIISNNGKITEIPMFSEIDNNIYSTGELPSTYKGLPMPEQSLVIKTERGLTVITGCSHPGIVNILDSVIANLPDEKINFVLGGFHLIDHDEISIDKIIEYFREKKIEFVAPTHCTGELAQMKFKKFYSDKYYSSLSGLTLHI